MLHDLRQDENVPRIAVVVGTDDVMISPENVLEATVSSNDIDEFLVTHTTHGINGRASTLEQTVGLLEKLRQQESREETASGPLAERIAFSGKISDRRKARILNAVGRLDARTSS